MMHASRRMRIAILGARCLPARYGGTETFSEILAKGLVARGHDVTVYCCAPYQTDRSGQYCGIRRVVLPAIRTAALEKFTYAALSFMHVCASNAEIILMNQVGAGPFCVLPRLFGKKVVINPDGLDWKRSRWGWLGSSVLKVFEHMSAKGANMIAADSKVIAAYILATYEKQSVFIPYGADPEDFVDASPLPESACVRPRDYCLQVCRLEPENNAHVVVREFGIAKTPLTLRIVGGSPYSKAYGASLSGHGDPRIQLLGGLFGASYQALMKHAYVYIHGHEVGGTNPVLLDAMAAGQCILALDVDFNREVLGDAGVYFNKDRGDLARQLERIISDPKARDAYGIAALQRVRKLYPWSRTIEEHEKLFFSLSDKKSTK